MLLKTEQTNQCRRRRQQKTHIPHRYYRSQRHRMPRILRRPPVILRPDRLRHRNLHPNLRHKRKRIAHPHKKTRRPRCRHRIAAQMPQPQHISHAISHLHKRSRNQRHRHHPQTTENAALCQIYRFHIFKNTYRKSGHKGTQIHRQTAPPSPKKESGEGTPSPPLPAKPHHSTVR